MDNGYIDVYIRFYIFFIGEGVCIWGLGVGRWGGSVKYGFLMDMFFELN